MQESLTMKHLYNFALMVLFAATGYGIEMPDTQSKPNVLLICVDDLRTELGCYGSDLVQSPHIDRLADEGRLFTRHYVAQAACGPSRTCLLTGRFHRSWAAWKGNWWKNLPPDRPISLAHMFKLNGYRTIGLGKVSHSPEGPVDVPRSWDRAYKATGPWKKGYDAIFAFSKGRSYNRVARVNVGGPQLPYEMADVADNALPDGMNAEEAVRQLQDLKERGQPFFFAVGFYKPHSNLGHKEMHLQYRSHRRHHCLYFH